jgi:hypothetical protein
MIHIGYLVNPADLHSPAPPRSADRTPVSGRGLPKTGIFQISAGDYRRFPSCSGQFGRSTVRLHAQPRLPGTEFLDAETGRQKPPPKCANAHRDQNPGIESPEMPAETPYWTSCRKRAVCGDWMVEVVGHKLKTHHPVIEPVSDIRVGNGIFRCRDGGSRSAFLSCRD